MRCTPAHVPGHHPYSLHLQAATLQRWSHLAYRLAEEDIDPDYTPSQPGGDMYVKYNSILHGDLRPGQKPPLSVNFIRKFLSTAKRRGR